MRIELKNVLRRWKRALEKYGKLNADQLELDLDIIDREIRACIRNDEETANKLSLCRCFIIRGEYNTENFLAITNGLLYELEKETKKKNQSDSTKGLSTRHGLCFMNQYDLRTTSPSAVWISPWKTGRAPIRYAG